MAGARRKQKQADPAAAPPKRRRRNAAEETAETSAADAEEQPQAAEEQPQAADEEQQAAADVGDEENEDEDLINDMPIPDPPEPCMNADGSGARLMITSVDVENFKSYYGKQTLGPFHKVRGCFHFNAVAKELDEKPTLAAHLSP